ncbi:MAG: DUF4214 domain-containing protein, partial [Epsilonproteobacteria bacterium]|nr:DUF4214 domain-containing protein [Campylobacterota bacterium]
IIIAIILLLTYQTSLQAGTTPTLENTTKLYVATFNRAPDAGGLDYWANDAGLDLEGIAKSFFDQPETKEAYPADSSNTDFVEAVYQNLFNRASEAAGLEYWVAELDSGRIAKSTFILAVINGAQDTEEFGNDATILTHKTTVGLSFSYAGFNDTTDAREIMLEVTDDEGTVTAALEGYGIEVLPTARELLVGKTYYDAWVSDGVEGYAKLAFSETEITEDYYTDNIQQESSLSSYEILEHSIILIDDDGQSSCDVSGNDTAIQFTCKNDNGGMVYWLFGVLWKMLE